MTDDARAVVRARVYDEGTDRSAVEGFRCEQYGNRPAEAAERIIQGAPTNISDFGFWSSIVVAYDDSGIVGVVVLGLEAEDDPAITIFSLGTKLSRQHQGIGIFLKRTIMTVIAEMDEFPNSVMSQVHRTNYRMIKLNEKLGVDSDPDPEDGAFLMTYALLEPPSGSQEGASSETPDPGPRGGI